MLPERDSERDSDQKKGPEIFELSKDSMEIELRGITARIDVFLLPDLGVVQ